MRQDPARHRQIGALHGITSIPPEANSAYAVALRHCLDSGQVGCESLAHRVRRVVEHPQPSLLSDKLLVGASQRRRQRLAFLEKFAHLVVAVDGIKEHDGLSPVPGVQPVRRRDGVDVGRGFLGAQTPGPLRRPSSFDCGGHSGDFLERRAQCRQPREFGLPGEPHCLQLRHVRRRPAERLRQKRAQLVNDAAPVPIELANQLLDAFHRVGQAAPVNVRLHAGVGVGHEGFAAIPHPVGGTLAEHLLEAGVEFRVKVKGQLPHILDAGLPQRNLLEAGFNAGVRCPQAKLG